ncbi:MAG: type I-MYXAN CRISPR-associated protein Cas6/Cmx6 [Gammaproteobacteria bacterium]|nr:type I-MYXAN CRISPR-associated protein Cas6/Cmx6 [Gammaproteobacteria bacterium]
MLWEDEDKKTEFVQPDNVVDLSFKILCQQLPTTHAWELSQALYEILPWLSDETEVGVHQIHGATAGNGWERPADGELIHLSKRTRMNLRVPRTRVEEAILLVGAKMDIAGYEVEIGAVTEKPLIPLGTLFSRYVVVPDGLDEDGFVEWVVDELARRDIKLRKMLCGMTHTIQTPDENIQTRSLMMADLDKQTSIALQEQGVGGARHLGCGIFMPHKGIKAVGETEDKSHFSGT